MTKTVQTPKFTVIIVNFNGGEYVQGALDSLARQTLRDFEVILLDNQSTDGSINRLDTSGLPAFTLMAEDTNHGFARGNNLAAGVANGEWLALLNPDAVAAPDWLEQVEAGQARHPGARHFACAQFELHRDGFLDGAGDAYMIFGIPWRGGFGCPDDMLPEEGLCFSPCGASAIIHRQTFLDMGGFDERFFCYCEDVDLGYRMQRAGMDCVFLPSAKIKHAGSALSNKVSDFATIHGTRNRIWVYWKNTPWLLLLLTLPGHIAISLYLLVRAVMRGTAGPTLKGMRAGLAGLPQFVRWRVPEQWNARRISTWALARRMAWNPFVISNRRPHVRKFPSDSEHLSNR